MRAGVVYHPLSRVFRLKDYELAALDEIRLADGMALLRLPSCIITQVRELLR